MVRAWDNEDEGWVVGVLTARSPLLTTELLGARNNENEGWVVGVLTVRSLDDRTVGGLPPLYFKSCKF